MYYSGTEGAEGSTRWLAQKFCVLCAIVMIYNNARQQGKRANKSTTESITMQKHNRIMLICRLLDSKIMYSFQ